MKKRQDSDDFIQVLGATKAERRWRLWHIAIALLAIGVGLAAVAFFAWRENDTCTEQTPAEVIALTQVEPTQVEPGTMTVALDSINNVSFRIFNLKNPHPSLERTYPKEADSTLLLAIPAADYRRDNGEIVGDFVFRGERLARGQRKTGYLAILKGKMMIGNSETTEMRDYCEAHRGDFFRQYILVYDGQMQENRLKGKSFRRALVQRNEEWAVVETLNRESLYDFSEALADYGFTAALYLVGAPTPMVWREDGEWKGFPDADFSLCRHPNYLMFRR